MKGKRHLPKRYRWRRYEEEKKNLLRRPALTPEAYEAAIKEIATRWRV